MLENTLQKQEVKVKAGNESRKERRRTGFSGLCRGQIFKAALCGPLCCFLPGGEGR